LGEFNRSRPEANNILLSVLQEGILDFPVSGGKGETYLKVHPDFRVIFTSNPEEYAGVHNAQDALLDRMVTIDLEHYDHETEVKIAASKSRLSLDESDRVVSIVRELRARSAGGYLPTIRGCIMVSKSVKRHPRAKVLRDSEVFREICHDVLIAEMARSEDRKKKESLHVFLDQLIDQYCLPAVALAKEDLSSEILPQANLVAPVAPIEEVVVASEPAEPEIKKPRTSSIYIIKPEYGEN
jgi:nitric oxide reductase NorQ protein